MVIQVIAAYAFARDQAVSASASDPFRAKGHQVLEFVTVLNLARMMEEIVVLNDLLKKRETAYAELDEQRYRAEQELADRYRSFVAEILRLSLGGIAVFSFIYKQGSAVTQSGGNLAVKFAFAGVAMFSLSLVFALVFLYSASEGLRWYIAGLRALVSEGQVVSGKQGPDDYLAQRHRWIVQCSWSKLGAAVTLALGGICMALAILP